MDLTTKSPVLILAFNRSECFKQVLMRVLEAHPPRIFVSIDGPRKGNTGDQVANREIVRVLAELNKETSIHLNISETNQGCRQAVSSGISWFFSHVDEGIILEDDCVPTRSFFTFCDTYLELLRENPSIFSVGGFRGLAPNQDQSTPSFSYYPQVWGWGTWKRVWDLYSADIEDWPTFSSSKEFKDLTRGKPLVRMFWRRRWDAVFRGEIDTWDYQLTYIFLRNKARHLVPPINLIENVGENNGATHSTRRPLQIKSAEFSNPFKAIPEEQINHDSTIDRWMERRVFRVWWSGPYQTLRRFAKSLRTPLSYLIAYNPRLLRRWRFR